MGETTDTLSATLKRARKVTGLSLQDVADRCEMSKAHIWEIERGKATNLTVQTLLRLAHALGVPYLILCKAAFNSMTEGTP